MVGVHHNSDFVNVSALLERLNTVFNDGLTRQRQELLRQLGTEPLTATASEDDCYVSLFLHYSDGIALNPCPIISALSMMFTKAVGSMLWRLFFSLMRSARSRET